jgi:acylphosphatase
MKTVSLMITGTVQGVFYRASAKKVAKELHISGWIKNIKQGAVEAVVSGEDNALQQFIDWCRKGPENAEVEHVQISELPPAKFDGFEIR